MNKKIERLYVIGPITGIENNNLEEFERVRKLLEAQGYQVDIPHDFVDPRVCWRSAMLVSIHKLTSYEPYLHREPPEYRPIYDGIAMLDGCEYSKGACIECELTAVLNIKCKPYREWLELLQ